ncbi:MAG: hypothetical protein ACO3JL_06570 [Myxococcota bacterium]
MSLSDAIIEGWQQLGTARKRALREARLNAHYGAHVVSAMGGSLLRPLPDDNHLNLEWLKERRVLAGQPTDDHVRMRAALKVQDLSLALLDRDNGIMQETELDGVTVDGAMAWLDAAATKAKGRDTPLELKRPATKLPDAPLAQGKPFGFGDEDAQRELMRWFANADLVLRVLFSREDDAGPVRCRPDTFELSTFLAREDDDERGVRVGMSPGDAFVDEPYFFVKPVPTPSDPPLSPIGEALWFRDGFFGAILPMGRLREEPDAQLHQVTSFLDTAIAACRAMV